MTIEVTKFDPSSKIKSGKNGLANTSASKSHVKITGENLEDNKKVEVCYAGSTTVVWSGTTYGTNGPKEKCRVKLTKVSSAAAAKGPMGDGDTAVSVTVGTSQPQTFQVLTGPPLDGSYSVACNGTGGNTYKWLAPNGTTGVQLSLASNAAPVWVFTLLQNEQGNCYTIQCVISGTTYYLQWANSGAGTNVALTTAAGAGTGWLLDSDGIKAVDIPSHDPATPNWTLLYGDTTSGTVNIRELADPNDGTLWSLGTYGIPKPRA